MNKFSIPFIGPVDLTNDDWYEAILTINNHEVNIDIDFQLEEVEQHQLDMLHHLLGNITKYNHDNLHHIHSNYHDPSCDTVKFYIKHHLEESEEETFAHLIDFNNPSASPEQQFLACIHLTRIGVSLEDEQCSIVFDYTIDDEITNDLIVVNTDAKGNLDYITIES